MQTVWHYISITLTLKEGTSSSEMPFDAALYTEYYNKYIVPRNPEVS
jgi:hypothetical protein